MSSLWFYFAECKFNVSLQFVHRPPCLPDTLHLNLLPLLDSISPAFLNLFTSPPPLYFVHLTGADSPAGNQLLLQRDDTGGWRVEWGGDKE